MNKQDLNNFQERIFDFIIYLTYFLIILSFFGVSEYAPKYLNELDYYVRIYICLFLMWRFNPFRSYYDFTNLDRKIAFSAGAFILTTTALNNYLISIQNEVKNLL
jgi:hypothetical protein